MTQENMKYIGEHIFLAAKEIFHENEDLKFEDDSNFLVSSN